MDLLTQTVRIPPLGHVSGTGEKMLSLGFHASRVGHLRLVMPAWMSLVHHTLSQRPRGYLSAGMLFVRPARGGAPAFGEILSPGRRFLARVQHLEKFLRWIYNSCATILYTGLTVQCDRLRVSRPTTIGRLFLCMHYLRVIRNTVTQPRTKKTGA